jgi:hypothetical protein
MKCFIKNLFCLKEHITLKVIEVFYFLGMAALTLCLLGSLAKFLFSGSIVYAIIALVFGCITIIMFRIVCEFITIAFGLFDKLEEIRCAITGETPKKGATSGTCCQSAEKEDKKEDE